jgi:Flp pilus assembly protein TadG
VTRARGEDGQATAELALLLPILAVLLLAVLQVAAVARDAVLVTHTAREAARAAAVDPRPGAASTAARQASGLPPEALDVRVARSPDGRSVKVTIRYRSETSAPLVGVVLPPVVHVASATMLVEW